MNAIHFRGPRYCSRFSAITARKINSSFALYVACTDEVYTEVPEGTPINHSVYGFDPDEF